ncbi:hypothetical protein GGR50DRAFT_702193, partial [Xylaria sp. CBS 124048]
MSPFQTMLSLWEKQHNISRDAHAQLVEILQLADSLDEIKSTPKRLETSLKHIRRSLPLRKIRKLELELDNTVLPTRTKLTEDLLIFDMKDLVATILSSPQMRSHAHIGMARLVDGEILNPWEANWWGESVRSTSGQFFTFPDGKPIFPSDFISWRCPGDGGCSITESPFCSTHFGRVRYCGWDYRLTDANANTVQQPPKPILLVQKVIDRAQVSGHMAVDIHNTIFRHRTMNRTELILIEDDEVALSPADVTIHIPDVKMDYHFDPTGPVTPGPMTSEFTVRLIYNQGRREYRVVKLSAPHRAELELKAYGREHFLNFAGREMISLPFQVFIDAFGLYRNMYRTLMGIYLTPEFFPHNLRDKRANIFPLTLGPHGSNFTDVLAGLYHIKELDSGTTLTLDDGTEVF